MEIECCDACRREIIGSKDWIRMLVHKSECGRNINVVLCENCSKYVRRLLEAMGEVSSGNGIKEVEIQVYENETKT